jgi:hypothetical protein
MPSVTRPWLRAPCPEGERSAGTLGRCRDPDTLIEEGEAIEAAFERLAAAESDNAMRNAYLDMAAAYRRANKDVGRHWRDVRG